MIIDIHTHIFPDKIAERALGSLSGSSHVKPSASGTMEGLLFSMEDAGIDISVALNVATNIDQVPKLNKLAISQVAINPKIIMFGAMHPDFPDKEKELVSLKEAGVLGIKLHPLFQNRDIKDKGYQEIFKICNDLDLIVLTHAGMDISYPGVDLCNPRDLRDIADRFPDLRLVLAHMGGWMQWDIVMSCLVDTGVLVDTAYSIGRMNPVSGEADKIQFGKELLIMEDEDFVKMVESFGADRVLFGSDSPWASQYYMVEKIQNLPLSNENKDLIFYKNSAKLLGISL